MKQLRQVKFNYLQLFLLYGDSSGGGCNTIVTHTQEDKEKKKKKKKRMRLN